MVGVSSSSEQLESAIYAGSVYHKRYVPTEHSFNYKMYFFWLKLSELNEPFTKIKHFGVNQSSAYQFRTKDYFPTQQPASAKGLEHIAKSKMEELGACALTGDIYFMGQVRALGVFFSPANFYFHKNPGSASFDWMLAEVSNTPWNERHYYLVNMDTQQDTNKEFHVSPFNPIDMQYRWEINQPGNNFKLNLSCYKTKRHFTASLNLTKQPLTHSTMRGLLFRMPSTTLFSLMGIYWQALRLLIKRAPLYSHPNSSGTKTKENSNESK